MRLTDISLAIRQLTRRPAFAVTALLLLALGAGANAAVFSVVRGVLLRPLPFHEPDRLVMLWPDTFITNEDLAFVRERARTFEHIAAVAPGWMMSLGAPGQEPIKVTVGRTSDNFFTTLGATPARGRAIQPGDSTPGAPKVIVISASLHEHHFAGDPNIVGRTVQLDGVEHSIAGVMPARFEFLGPGTDLWTPLPFAPGTPTQRSQFSRAFARLAPGTSIERADLEIRDLTPSLRDAQKKPADWGRNRHVLAMQDHVTGDVRPALLILLAAVGLILLLASVNLGALVLSRSIERTKEMAVRTALGATRARLWQQLLVEQTVLSAAGAALGVVAARLMLPWLVRFIPPEVPRQQDIALDGLVLITVTGATILASVVSALLPVAAAARPELQPLLRQNQSTDTPSRRRMLGVLVTAQLALAIVLGIGAGLMLRSLWHLRGIDPGFTATNVLTFRLQTTSKPLNLTRGLEYFEQVLERVRSMPGVERVGAIQHLPMTGYNWTSNVWRPEAPPAPGAAQPQAIWRFVGWDYFETMGIRLIAGRTLTMQDRVGGPAVAVINESLARREFGSASEAVGRRLATYAAGGPAEVQIVGVVADVRFRSLHQPAEPEIYRPVGQAFMFPMAFVVRTTGDPAALAGAVRQAAYAVDPMIAVAEIQPLTALIAATLGQPRLLGSLLTVFAAAGLALAMIGVYGVVAYRVRQQEREFGIRLALGAEPARIARRVARQTAGYALAGLLLGVPAAWLLSRLMASVLYGVGPHDTTTFLTLPAGVIAAAFLASALPARRAASIDPMRTMKSD